MRHVRGAYDTRHDATAKSTTPTDAMVSTRTPGTYWFVWLGFTTPRVLTQECADRSGGRPPQNHVRAASSGVSAKHVASCARMRYRQSARAVDTARRHVVGLFGPRDDALARECLCVIAGPGWNVVAARGADGNLLVDSGAANQTSELLEAVKLPRTGARCPCCSTRMALRLHGRKRENSPQPPRKIVAHENTRPWLGGGFPGLRHADDRPWPFVVVADDTLPRTTEKQPVLVRVHATLDGSLLAAK